jgi:hypothetical protein
MTCKQPTRCNKFRLLIFLNQPNMFLAKNSPIVRSNFDCIHSFWYNASTLLPTGNIFQMEIPVPSQPCHRSAVVSVRCTKGCVYSQNCSWWWANLSPETCSADLKRSINRICCILLVPYIVVLVMPGHTYIEFKCNKHIAVMCPSGHPANFKSLLIRLQLV